MATVAFFAASPDPLDRVALDDEIRAIRKRLRAADHRDALQLDLRPATRAADIIQALNEARPEVVHFSGHGRATGIALQDEDGQPDIVDGETLAGAVRSVGGVRLVVLNACASETQAAALARVVECVVTMQGDVEDEAARVFAAAFYSALAFDLSVHQAFDQAENELRLVKRSGDAAPRLRSREGVDPTGVYVLRGARGHAAPNGDRRTGAEPTMKRQRGTAGASPARRTGGRAAAATSQVDPEGPVFIAYTLRGEGACWAEDTAAALRAWGVPVWHDACDLRPGNVEARIREALSDRLSGAVLVATPEITDSGFLRDVELPELHRLATQPAFGHLVLDVRPDAAASPGALDVRSAGRSLADALTLWERRPVSTRADLAVVAERFAQHRLGLFASTGAGELPMRFCTREEARSARGPGLIVSYGQSPPNCKRPPADMWPPFRRFLAGLKGLVSAAGVSAVRVSGRAQLTPAFALGAALPEPSQVDVRVANARGQLWEGTAEIEPSEELARWGDPKGAVAVFVDMLKQPAHPTFDEHLAAHREQFAASLKLVTPQRRELTPAEGATLARKVAERMRTFAGEVSIHLFLAVPFEMAVRLGVLSNTLDIQLYEREQEPTSHYVPTVRCRAGVGGGPIIAVLDRAP